MNNILKDYSWGDGSLFTAGGGVLRPERWLVSWLTGLVDWGTQACKHDILYCVVLMSAYISAVVLW